MQQQGDPFRPIYFLIMIIIALACLFGLYFQNPEGVLGGLSGVGICLGVVFLIFVIGAIYGGANERKNKLYQAREPERLKEHQARFYCHICGKPSPQPYQYWDDYGENGQLYSSFLVTDYDKPTELVQCSRCQKWTCSNASPPHLVNGVCQTCLQNSYGQVW